MQQLIHVPMMFNGFSAANNREQVSTSQFCYRRVSYQVIYEHALIKRERNDIESDTN